MRELSLRARDWNFLAWLLVMAAEVIEMELDVIGGN